MNNKMLKKVSCILAATLAFSVAGVSAAGMTNDEIYQKAIDAVLTNNAALVNELVHIDTSENFVESIDAKIVIDENEILHEIDDLMLGVQCEAGGLADISQEPGSIELTNDYKNFAKDWFKCPLYRFGGTSAENMNLMHNIGPFEKREASYFEEMTSHTDHIGETRTSPTTMGPVEFIKFVYANNPDAKIIICVSVNSATPEDNKNLAAFLTHRADESEWGALRASYGLVEPVEIYAWEVGNEIYASIPYKDPVLEWYPPVAKAHMDAIRESDPDAKFALCGVGAPWGYAVEADWRRWTTKLLEDLVALGETQFDYMTCHPYYDGMTTPYQERTHMKYTEDVAKILGEDNTMEFLMTEHSTWTDPLNNGKLQSLDHALSVAQWITRMYHYDNIAGATYHGITAGGMHWAMYRRIDGKIEETLMSEMYRAYSTGVGDRIVKSEVISDSPTTELLNDSMRFTVMPSVKGDRELNLILCNDYGPGAEYNLTFEFANNYTLKEETIFTAPNMSSLRYDKNSLDVGTTTVTEKNEKNFSTYRMPPQSLVILKLESDKDIPQYGEKVGGAMEEVVAEDVETGFVDLENCWAKNEIAKMAEIGAVNGRSETVFAPEENVTRGEYAAIVCRMLEFDVDYKKSHFKDVDDDAWYMPYINAAQIEGVLKGDSDKNFRPDDNITLEEMIIASNRLCEKYGITSTGYNADEVLSQFEYADDISNWAKDGVAAAVKNGIIYRLYENGGLKPLKKATRAETASVLYRVYNLVK